jgi:hypothetical protein
VNAGRTWHALALPRAIEDGLFCGPTGQYAVVRFTDRLGLTNPKEGTPRRPGPRRSRYGLYVSRRLDEDLAELSARVKELERRLDTRE